MERGDDIRWASGGTDLVTGWCGPNWPARRFLVVEAVPGGGWDWVAWRSRADTSPVCGAAKTREAAMREAERAVSQMRQARPS